MTPGQPPQVIGKYTWCLWVLKREIPPDGPLAKMRYVNQVKPQAGLLLTLRRKRFMIDHRVVSFKSVDLTA